MKPDGIVLRSRNKVKRIILCCLSPFFLIAGFFIKTYATLRIHYLERKASYKYKLAIVLIAKDEGDYLEEWLAFHKVMGIDHVFLYDNDSIDQTKEVVQPYIDCGFVTYNLIPGEKRQFDAYNHALKEYGQLCKYMAVIDADEFFYRTIV